MVENWSQRLDQVVQSNGRALAIRDHSTGETQDFTFTQFADRVRVLKTFIEQTTAPDSRIAILLLGGAECVTAFWAAACSNRCYTPLYADLALDRLRSILVDTDPSLVFIARKAKESLDPMLVELGYRFVDHETGSPTVFYLKDRCLSIELSEAPAVILFTSGSTGLPKGIVHSRRSFSTAIDDFTKAFNIKQGDRVFSCIPPHFDAATYDIFSPLMSGATLIIPEHGAFENPRKVAQTLAESEATIVPSVPTTMRLMLNYGKPERFDYNRIRSAQVGGEILTVDFAQKMQKTFPNAIVTNMFGPAEIISCCWYSLPNDFFTQGRETVPIGRPFASAETKIKDDGELWVTGEQLMIGYWNNPVLNAEKIKFEDGRRWYATGDIVALNADGDLEFKGRRDRLVKRRGVRVELDDVHRNIEKMPGIAEVGVVAKEDERLGCRVIAHVRLEPGDERDGLILKDEAQKFLPTEMVPDRFAVHSELPRTSTGKIDLQALAKLS